ncbi:hypothetical protein N787_06645 [Arenimonas metalli CF5-1]|uniref:Major facilitator superfamily (MFS) profile domain-containing protein n=1 Tax=Arenimonas metalli CF5-1 TaxID=1384056 RepID=A0A091B641_9GAMM|nr:hypothetical protein N787_06645 [Arenimonas metalli CF5-1]
MPAFNALGGALADVMRLPAGGTLRLAWDLGWLLLSAFVAVWLPARGSPLWPRALALALAGLWIAAAVWAAWNLESDFPTWFVAAVLIGVPIAASAAVAVGARGRRVAPPVVR